MSLFGRLAAAALVILCVAVGLGLLATAPVSWDGTALQVTAFLCFLLAAIIWLWSYRVSHMGSVLVCETSLGQVRITQRAVEYGVLRHVRQVSGVRDATIKMQSAPAGLRIDVALSMPYDVALPDLSAEVQQQVERYVRQCIGTPIQSISVEIMSVRDQKRTRVE